MWTNDLLTSTNTRNSAQIHRVDRTIQLFSRLPVRGVRVSAPYENGTQETGPELAALWARTLERLAGQSEVTPQFQAWLALTRPIALVEDTAVLAAPHDFAKDVLESRLRPALTAALAAEIGRDVRVAVTVEALTVEPMSGEPDDAEVTDRRSDLQSGGPTGPGGIGSMGTQRRQCRHEYDETGRIAANT